MNADVQLVREFLTSTGRTLEENVAAFEKYLAHDVTWDTGSRILYSLADSIAHLRHLPNEYGVGAFEGRIIHAAGEDGAVLTERVDDVYTPDGRLLYGARVMGVLEVREGRIVAWRDYYDTAALGREMAAAKSALGI